MKKIIVSLICLALCGCSHKVAQSAKAPTPTVQAANVPPVPEHLDKPASQNKINLPDGYFEVDLNGASFGLPNGMSLDTDGSKDGVTVYRNDEHTLAFGFNAEETNASLEQFSQVLIIGAKLQGIDINEIYEGKIDNQRALMLVIHKVPAIDLHFIVKNKGSMLNFDCAMAQSRAKHHIKTCDQIIKTIKLQ